MSQKDLFLEQQLYCFDTSSLILLRQVYPVDIFKPVHDFTTAVLKSGKIMTLDLILEELKQKESDLYNYIKVNVPKERQAGFENYIQTSQSLIRKYYDGKGKSHNLKADPHIIACAKDEDIVVVTEELNSDETRIPYVCTQENVKWLNFVEFLRKENFKI